MVKLEIIRLDGISTIQEFADIGAAMNAGRDAAESDLKRDESELKSITLHGAHGRSWTLDDEFFMNWFEFDR